MKRSIVLALVFMIMTAGAIITYFLIFEQASAKTEFIKSEEGLNFYRVKASFSRSNMPEVEFPMPSPIVFTGVDPGQSRDLYCLYSNGALYNITNTKDLNESRVFTADNSRYIVMEIVRKGRKSSAIGFIDTADSQYYMIEGSGNCENLISSQDSPLIAFTDSGNKRWALVVADLSAKKILHKEYNPENNNIPGAFSENGKYLYWLKGYPALDKVKSIMRTDLEEGETETIIHHDNKKHEGINVSGDMIYFTIAEGRAHTREIYSYNTKTGEHKTFLSEENMSVFVHAVNKGYIVVPAHESLARPGEDPAEIPKRQVMQRVFESQVNFQIRDIITNQTLAVIERAASLAFHPEHENYAVFSVLKRNEGISIGLLNLDEDRSQQMIQIPLRFPNYPKFFTSEIKNHFWLEDTKLQGD